MNEYYLHLKQIRKQYGDQIVLHGVDLAVNQGEFFFLLGPSGCGKTTLLKIVSGLLVPDSGSIFLKGSDITNTPSHLRDVNTVFQNYALFPHMNVFDNISFGLRMKKLSSDIIRTKVGNILELVGLPGFDKRFPHQMSGGQMQRVALARALVNNPSVLLLDEPLGALDVKLRKQIQSELRNIQRELGTTFICVTHDQDEAMILGDRIAVMHSGNVEQIGKPQEIYNKPNTYYVCDFMGDCNFIKNLTFEAVKDNQLATSYLGVQLFSEHSGVNQPNSIGIRPERIHLAPANRPDNPENKSSNRLSANVTDIVFSGHSHQITCELSDGNSMMVRVSVNNNVFLPELGDEVHLSWKTSDSILVHI